MLQTDSNSFVMGLCYAKIFNQWTVPQYILLLLQNVVEDVEREESIACIVLSILNKNAVNRSPCNCRYRIPKKACNIILEMNIIYLQKSRKRHRRPIHSQHTHEMHHSANISFLCTPALLFFGICDLFSSFESSESESESESESDSLFPKSPYMLVSLSSAGIV